MADNVEHGEGLGAPEPKQLTEIEQRAIEQGWRPQDEWDGEPDAWRSAKEFLDRGELFKKIDEQNRTIKEFRRTLEEFKHHHAKVREVEYKRARDELLRQKKEALLENDADAVVEIDERLDMVKEAARAASQPPVTEPVLNPVFVAWKERNNWYDSNRAMRAFADQIGNELGARGVDPVDILSEVERQVKKEFPDKFENPRRQRAGAVEGGAKPASGTRKETVELTADERRAMQKFVRSGILTEEQYMADIKAYKEKTR